MSCLSVGIRYSSVLIAEARAELEAIIDKQVNLEVILEDPTLSATRRELVSEKMG
jgi:hypothetical protein